LRGFGVGSSRRDCFWRPRRIDESVRNRYKKYKYKNSAKAPRPELLHDRKWEAYTGCAATVRDVLRGTKNGKLEREMPKIIGGLYDFMSDLWLVGSDGVVKAVLRWRRYSQETDASKAQGLEALVCLGDIMIAMRRDLGDTETQIEARDIFKYIH